MTHIALIDGGSFVLPYDHALARGLAARGWRVSVFGSRTRYNGSLLDALRATPGVDVAEQPVSGTVSPRWRGVWAYAMLWRALWRRRAEFDAVNLQFSVLWPLELPLLWALRRRLVFTVHNAVPHGFGGRRHRPTAWIAALAARLVFVSSATRDDFLQRYGARHAAKASVLPHGLLPLAGDEAVPCVARPTAPEALVFWSTVKPYKGVELMAALARSPAWQARGMALEVWGAWDRSLHPLREELRALGVRVVDDYLDAAALQALLARPVVFVLPYRDASQSGALYTLLAQGARFICSDVGDLGAFLREQGLDALLLRERTPDEVLRALDHLARHEPAVCQALRRAQAQRSWAHTLADAERAHGLHGPARHHPHAA